MRICFIPCSKHDINQQVCECNNEFIKNTFMEQYRKNKSLTKLSKINPYLFSIELKNGELVKITKVLIDGKDAFVLLENGKYYNFLSDETIQVIERPSSSYLKNGND